MGNENESTPVIMLDPADVQIVSAAQSSIRQAMLYVAETLRKYLPEGAVGVSVHASVREDATVYGNVQVRNGYGDGTVCGCKLFHDLATDTILRAFDRACADFTRQMEERDAEND
jgi:phosphotransacetylase